MTLALIAQEAVERGAVELVDDIIGPWLPVLALVLPVVLAAVMHVTSERWAKAGIAVVGAAIVTAVSIWVDGPIELSWPILTARFALAATVAERAYRTLNLVIKPYKPGGLNDLFPGGIRFGQVVDELGQLKDRLDDMTNQLRGRNST